jgi:hypothetical protein
MYKEVQAGKKHIKGTNGNLGREYKYRNSENGSRKKERKKSKKTRKLT